MNAPILLAQLQGNSTQSGGTSPRHIKLEKPPGGATITVNLQGANQLDFSDIDQVRAAKLAGAVTLKKTAT